MFDPLIFNAISAAKAEQMAELPSEWLEVIYREKLFQLFVPRELGGRGASLPEALKIEEELAFTDGSLGWTVTLCAGAGWFAGFFEKDLRKEVFQDPKVCLAGSGFVGGEADLQGEEYLVSGHWSYASGALHATHFTANCELLENGKAIVDESGSPVVKAITLKKEEVKILDGWNYMGMVATGSHAFKTENLRVPLNRGFEIFPEKATLNEPIYRYPFLQFAEVTLAVNILGITRHLIQLIEKAFKTRHSYRKYDERHLGYFEKVFEKQNKKLKSLKKEFHSAIEFSWNELQKEGKISKSSLKKISRISRKLTQNCREISGKLYPFAGLEAAKTNTELNRVWRDFNTVSQHALLIFPF
jgi:alkylation response protein AidB-like acyl-CoA dehydrogenase